MQTIKLKSYVGEDGVLQLQLPIGVKNTDLEVIVVFQPLKADSKPSEAKTPEELGYSREFIEVLGSWEGELERPEQTPFQEREEINWDTF